MCLPPVGWTLGDPRFLRTLLPHLVPCTTFPSPLYPPCSSCHFFLQKELFSQRFPLSSFFLGLCKAIIAWLLWKHQESNLKKCLEGIFFFLLASLSIRGLWSPSYSSCLQEPSLNQYFDVKSMFSTPGPLRETWGKRLGSLTSSITLLLSLDLTSAALSRWVSNHHGAWPEQRLGSRPPLGHQTISFSWNIQWQTVCWFCFLICCHL